MSSSAQLIDSFYSRAEITTCLELELPIRPEAKQSAIHGGGKTWISPKKMLYVNNLKFCITSQYKGPLLSGPIRLTVCYCFKWPKYGKVKQRHKVFNVFWDFFTSRPDIDNLTKPLQDALSGTVCSDDSQVVDLRAQKLYWEENLIVLKLEQLRIPARIDVII